MGADFTDHREQAHEAEREIHRLSILDVRHDVPNRLVDVPDLRMLEPTMYFVWLSMMIDAAPVVKSLMTGCARDDTKEPEAKQPARELDEREFRNAPKAACRRHYLAKRPKTKTGQHFPRLAGRK